MPWQVAALIKPKAKEGDIFSPEINERINLANKGIEKTEH